MNGAAVFCQRSDGRVLFGQRRAGPNAGRWVLPGGHVEAGERLTTTAEREFLEETGFRLAWMHDAPEHHVHMPDGRIIYFFRARPNAEPVAHDKEFSELVWATAEDARKLDLTKTMHEVLVHLWPEFADWTPKR